MTTPRDRATQTAQAKAADGHPDSEAAALARSDRYLREFVEALELCPYARRCRETGRLHRKVLLPADRDAAAAARLAQTLAAVAAIEALPPESVEVALLIFPAFDEGARAFEGFCRDVREGLARVHAGAAPFFCVAFHPELPMDLSDEHRAVHFVRRSPDPTLQLVRASVLTAIRGARTGGSTFVDARQLSLADLLALQAPEGVSERIARANFETLQREGGAALAARLASFRQG